MKDKLITILLFFSAFILNAQNTVVTIVDERNEPIPNTHIIIKETNQLFLTDIKGKATILFPEDITSITIEISFIGFVKKELTIVPNQKLTIVLEEDLVTLNSFVITGQYAENSPEKAVQKITIIDKDKINKMAAVNLNDVLQNETNIRLSQDGILGSSMSVQGLSGENVKIMIDGVPVIGRLDGNIDISQFNLNDVERIEVIEGPMSVNYGTNALAGVVNIITKKTSKSKANVNVNSYYENIGKYNLDGGFSVAFSKHSLGLTGGRNYFDGWRDGDPAFKENERIADTTRFKTWKPKEQYFGKLKYNYTLKGGDVGYTLNYFDEKITNRGMPRMPYFETAFDDYYFTTRIDNSIYFNKKFAHQKNINFQSSYNYFNRTKNTYFKDLTTLNETQTTNSSDQDTSIFHQIMIRATYSTSIDTALINYEVGIHFNIESTRGQRIDNQTQEINDYAFFGSLEYKPFSNTTIRPGVRYSYNTNYPAPITPSINIKQTIKKFNIRASYARGFRSPSLKELYFNFVDINHNIKGNTELEAENSNNFILAVNYTKLIKTYLLKMELSSFYNDVDNLITLAQINNTEYSYVNIGDFSTHGLQFNSNVSYNHFKMGIGASYLGRLNELSKTTNVDKYNYSPELRANLNYELKKWNSFIALFYKLNGKLTNYALNSSNEVYQTYISSYQMADVSVGKRFWKSNFILTIGSKNVFDVKNVNSLASGGAHSSGGNSSLVATGRTYFVKLNFNLNYDKEN